MGVVKEPAVVGRGGSYFTPVLLYCGEVIDF